MNKTGFKTETANERTVRFFVVYAFLAAALTMVLVLNINTGNVSIPLTELLQILSGKGKESTAYSIIWMIRLPRILEALILGGALAVSGFLLQTFFGNPIAGPFVLGISSGAKFSVALYMIFFMSISRNITSWSMIFAAFIGALISTGFILLVSTKVKDAAGLLVAGIMIGYICSAATDFLMTFAEDSDIVNLRGWSLGSFSGMSWNNVYVSAIVVGIVFAVTLMMSKPIGALQLGENYAKSMGVNVRMFMVVLIVLSSILSATVTAFAGPISFVGIAVPFLVKQLFRSSKPLVVIPASFLMGAVFCMACDLIARCAFAPIELNISTVTSIFGAPIVIFMLMNRKKKSA
ncbi:FecCD family ABC transporter permease [Oribacterium sp. WCC10]|uniref:FecCD family ABC transporter permease n=1 Tax=Oribacterium sp. WCC10 TaxID=1855343 RepID=UPI0008F26063|nr:iron ABC transporter permease [Oribacterium sp. WCC10]SFG75287.1 iron complex transport system permease protein [Oribacterium sp. WCC10]